MSVLTTKLRRDIGRQRAQFLAVAITVMLGTALFAASYDAYLNLQASYDGVFDRLSTANYWIEGGDSGAIVEAVSSVDGVLHAGVRIQADVPLRIGEDKLIGRLVSTGDDLHPKVNDIAVLDGGEHGVVADQHTFDHFGLSPGDRVDVLSPAGEWQATEIAGSVVSAEYLWPARSRQDPITLPQDFGVLFAPDDVVEDLAGATHANQVVVRYVDGANVEAINDMMASIATRFGAAQHYSRAEQPSNSVLQEDVSGFSEMAFLFPALFLTAAGMASFVLLSRRVRMERSVIGMLRAQGIERRPLLRHYLGFGLVAGVAGSVPGVGLGLVAAASVSRYYTGFIDLPFTEISFHPETVAIGIGFGLVTGWSAAWAPARKAAATDPAEAMRGVIPATGGRRTMVERVLPGSQHLPVRWRMTLRSITRNRRRSVMTAAGVVLSLLLVLVSWSMIDTINTLLDKQFTELDRSDAQVWLAGPAGMSALDEIRSVEGMRMVEPLTTADVTLVGPHGTYATQLIAPPVDTTMRTFDIVEGDAADLSGPGLLMGDALRDDLGVDVGDEVSLRLTEATGERNLFLEVAGFVSQPLGTFVYIDREELGEILGAAEVPVTGAQITIQPDASIDAVRRDLTQLDTVTAVQPTDALRRLLDEAIGLFYAFVAVMLVAGALLAATVIFTIQSVTISERSTEVATLRASGVSLRDIAGMITLENLLVTLGGVVPGLVLGVIGGKLMFQTFSSDQFAFDFTVHPATLLWSAVALLVVAMASQVPGLRALRKLDLAATVRERAS